MIKKILQTLEIDKHIGQSLLLRLWSIFSGVLLIILIPSTLTAAQQGYYFTFSSLLATQVFFELGLNTVILQIVGHERAHLEFEHTSMPSGPDVHLSRLYSVFQLLRKAYRIISILFFLFALIGGCLFFKTESISDLEWFPIWFFLVLFTTINLYISPFLASIEGMGFVADVAKLRLKQSIVGSILLCSLLLSGIGLRAVIAVPATASIFSMIWLLKNFKWVLIRRSEEFIKSKVSWRSEIFPFQWKMALSWLSGYFISQLINPVVFKKFGPIEAGKIGLALTVFATIGALSYSWVNAKVPEMVKLIALSQITELKKLFWGVLLRSTILNFVCGMLFILVIFISKKFNLSIVTRIPSVEVLGALMLITFINNLIFSAAAYMRAYKEEPMLLNSIIVALLISVAVYVGSYVSVLTIVWLNALVMAFVALPWTLIIFKKYYLRRVRV